RAPAQPEQPARAGANAQSALAKAEASAASTQATTPESLEPKLGSAQRRGVQQQLAVLGFYDRPADGSFGRSTRDAIRKFQVAYGLAPTGYLDDKETRILKEAAAAKDDEIAAAAAQLAEQQADAKKLADEKAAQEKAEA